MLILNMRLSNGYAGLLKWSQQTVHWLSQLGGNPCASLQALPTLAHSPLLLHLSYFHRKCAPSTANAISDPSVITKRVLDLSNISLFAYIVYNDNPHRKQFHHRKKKKKCSSIQGSIENTLLREHPCIHVQYLLHNQTKLFQTHILLQV